MANEFIARNGITSLGNIVVSGSITTTGTVAISGSFASASFAATASSADNLLVRNTLTAQTLVVQTITSSVDFVTGSTQFGTLLTNTHVFSGSVTINPGGLFVSSSGNVGISTLAPNHQLATYNSTRNATTAINAGNSNTIPAISIQSDVNAWTDASNGFAFVYNTDNGNLDLYRKQGSTTQSQVMTWVRSNGNVGIGTLNPARSLHLSSSSDVYMQVDRGSITSLFGTDNIGTYIGQQGAFDLRLITNATERMRIASTGATTFSSTVTATGAVRSINGGVDGTYQDAFVGVYSGNNNEQNAIQTAVSSVAGQSGFRFQVSNGGGSSARTSMMDITRSGASIRLGFTIYGATGTYTSGDNPFLGIGGTGSDTFGVINAPFGDKMRFNAYHGHQFYTSNAGASGTPVSKMVLFSEGYLSVEGNGNGWTIGQASGVNRIDYTSSTFRCLNTANGFTPIAASAFNVNSDYRLKEDLKEFNNSLSIVDSIKIYDFKWKDRDERNYGVIAHELQEVLPYTVYGEKDGLGQNEEIITQGVDYGKLVPVLVKAIQELKAQNDDLQSQINELKAQ
jgi:hypothetical protein